MNFYGIEMFFFFVSLLIELLKKLFYNRIKQKHRNAKDVTADESQVTIAPHLKMLNQFHKFSLY